MSCGVGCRCGSDPALLWLWRGPVATALIQPLAWEPPYSTGAALEKAKRLKRKKKKGKKETRKATIILNGITGKSYSQSGLFTEAVPDTSAEFPNPQAFGQSAFSISCQVDFYLANHSGQISITQKRILRISNSRWIFCCFIIAESSPLRSHIDNPVT